MQYSVFCKRSCWGKCRLCSWWIGKIGFLVEFVSSKTATSCSLEKEQRFYLVSRGYTAFCLVWNKMLEQMTLIFLVHSMEKLPGPISLGGLLAATVLEFSKSWNHVGPIGIATNNKMHVILVTNIRVHGVWCTFNSNSSSWNNGG